MVGTLFSHDSSREVEESHRQSQAAKDSRQTNGTHREETGSADKAARDMAVAARDASRVLQSLSSKVWSACRH